MKYEILDPEVQKVYYFVKKQLDLEGFGSALNAYIAGYSGKIKIKKNFIITLFDRLIFLIPLPLIPFIFIAAVILIIAKYILLGVGIILGLIALYYIQGKRFDIEGKVTEDFQTRRLRLMNLVASGMSRSLSAEEITEEFKKEIERVLKQERI